MACSLFFQRPPHSAEAHQGKFPCHLDSSLSCHWYSQSANRVGHRCYTWIKHTWDCSLALDQQIWGHPHHIFESPFPLGEGWGSQPMPSGQLLEVGFPDRDLMGMLGSLPLSLWDSAKGSLCLFCSPFSYRNHCLLSPWSFLFLSLGADLLQGCCRVSPTQVGIPWGLLLWLPSTVVLMLMSYAYQILLSCS